MVKNPVKMEENPVYFLQKIEGTWRLNDVVPDVPADYVGRPLGMLSNVTISSITIMLPSVR